MIQDTLDVEQTITGEGKSLLAGRYNVLRQLGTGGMGSVWLAEDTQLDGMRFAIKMLPAVLVSNKRAYKQLKAEALVAMRLVHPNIVQIRAFEDNGGNPFIVMDYIEGETLDDYLADKKTLSEEETLRILKPIAKALDYAHGENVVHRDIKPANVMLRRDSQPFILDFGIAREIQETMTRVTGKLSSGTLLYMSPEQLNGAPPKSPQDVYSFAAMAYECLKGEPPFSRGQIEYQILNNSPEPLNPGLRLARSIMAGLEKDPARRPDSCSKVLDGIGITSKPDTAQHKPKPQPIPSRPKIIVRTNPGVKPLSSPKNNTIPPSRLTSGAGVMRYLPYFALLVSAVFLTTIIVRMSTREKKSASYKQDRSATLLHQDRFEKDRITNSNVSANETNERSVASMPPQSPGTALKEDINALQVEPARDKKKTATKDFISCCNNYRYDEAATFLDKIDTENADVQVQLGVMHEGGYGVEKDYLQAAKWYKNAIKNDNGIAMFHLGCMYHEGKGIEKDVKKATELFKKALSPLLASARCGDVNAQFELGCIYENGYGVARKEIHEALKWYRMAANAGHPFAQYQLAYIYDNGDDVPINKIEAERWYGKAASALHAAAEHGYTPAQLAYGMMLEGGKGISKDTTEALFMFRMAAEANDKYAQTILGSNYWHGKGVSRNYNESVKWLRQAAEQDSPVAQRLLGRAYEDGLGGCQKDYDKALKWYKKAAAQDDAISQHNIGMMYWNGNGVKKNYDKALEWIAKSAAKGIAESQMLMGHAYEKGLGGLKIDYSEAIEWYKKAAEQKNAVAQHNLALMYWDGRGTQQSYANALQWLRKAAAQDLAVSQRFLGQALEKGLGCNINYEEAIQWYRKAAAQNDSDAASNLGIIYWEGIGVPQNFTEAVKWLRKGADADNPKAQRYLARSLEEGWGCERDYSESIKLNTKASLNGDAIAANNLGIMFWDGIGTPQNYANAIYWLRMAAEKGQPPSQYLLGLAYEQGLGSLPKDRYKALEWFTRAANQGHKEAIECKARLEGRR